MCIRNKMLASVSVLTLLVGGCSSNLDRLGSSDQFYTNSTAPQPSFSNAPQRYPGDTNLGPVGSNNIQRVEPVQNARTSVQQNVNTQRYVEPVQNNVSSVQSQTLTRVETAKTKVVDTGNQLDATRAATVKQIDHSVNAGSSVKYQAPGQQVASQAAGQLAPATTPNVTTNQNTQVAALPQTPTPKQSTQQAQAQNASFRWPAQGRVIAKFGQSVNGAANEGIDISLPEGTPVKATDGGTVIYSGSDVEGFGNLVIVRHANNWVSAYAHASQVFVKRGQTVRRGQTIAKSGRTGNASSPKLHFELRKKSTPVDPLRHLG